MNAKIKLTLLMSLFLIANISNAQDIDYNATIQNQIKIHQSNNLPSELKIQADLQAINRESVKEIREFFFSNQKNPKLIAELSRANGISLGDLSRATGYSRQLLSRFFTDAGVHDFKENPNEVRDLVYKNLNNKQELENIARIYNVNPNDLVREANTINQGNNQLQPPVPQFNQVNVIKKQPKVSDAELKAFFQKNIDNPDVIVQASKKFNFTINDLSRATGYSSKELAGYFKNAGLMTN